MNLLLLDSNQKISKGCYPLSSEQSLHIHKTLKLRIGDKIFAGELNSKMGHCLIIELSKDTITITENFNLDPPSENPINLIIALPRPKMLKRILRDVSMMGVKNIYLINTYKVEKSFWQSEILIEKKFERLLKEGLSQSKDTIMPTLKMYKRFKPFVEDEIPGLFDQTEKIVCHPGDHPFVPSTIKAPTTFAIGPEGGFTPYEVEKFNEAGFKTLQIGHRILRMEIAVIAVLAHSLS